MSDLDRKSLKLLIKSLKSFKTPSPSTLMLLLSQAERILNQEANLLSLNSPITICGDIHGSLDDLLEIFRLSGKPGETNYLFLGNYINIHRNSVEVLSLLLSYKILFPSKMILLRGSHESINLSYKYGFYQECIEKFGSSKIWVKFHEVFKSFPLAAIVGSKIFCVHSGISYDIDEVNKILDINRFEETKNEGPLMHLLLYYPDSRDGWNPIPGRSYDVGFGTDIIESFLLKNDLELIIRSRQMIMEGYLWHNNDKVLSIYSVSNYGGYKNLAAIVQIDENMKINTLIFDDLFKTNTISKDNFPDYFNQIDLSTIATTSATYEYYKNPNH